MHPNLSAVSEPSASKIFESWIKDSRIEVEYRNSNFDSVKDKILSELKTIVGKNLSQEKYHEYEINFAKQKNIRSLSMYVWNAQASGENMSVK